MSAKRGSVGVGYYGSQPSSNGHNTGFTEPESGGDVEILAAQRLPKRWPGTDEAGAREL